MPRKLVLLAILLLVLVGCSQQAIEEDDVQLAPQALGCTGIVPANAHKSRYSKPPYSEIGGKAQARCGHTDNNPTTLWAWVTIDEKIGPTHRVVARQARRRVDFIRYGQYIQWNQDRLLVFMKCRNGTFRTTLNFASNEPIQFGRHHSGQWVSISRCGRPG